MANETATLRIKAEKLGTIYEVKQFLSDIETAYNSIYTFEFIVDTLSNERERMRQLLDRQFYEWRRFSKEFSQSKDFAYDPFFLEFFWNKYVHKPQEFSTNLLDYKVR